MPASRMAFFGKNDSAYPRGATRGAADFRPPWRRPVAESRKSVAQHDLAYARPYPWRTTPCHVVHGGAAVGLQKTPNWMSE